MEKKNISGKNISRRDFLKAAGSAAVTAGMAAGCAGGSRNGGQHEGTPGEMTQQACRQGAGVRRELF